MSVSSLLLLVLTLWGSTRSSLAATNKCQEFSINDCAGDKAAIIFEINTSEELCQQYCTITPGCLFYRYDFRPIQGISCALYEEPFSAYAGHCDELSAAKGFPDMESCQAPAPGSCDIIQEGNCAYWGQIEETNSMESVENCAALCEFVTCDYWVYQRQSSHCIKQSNPQAGGPNRKCNVVYGPPHAENCEAVPEPTTTPDPVFTTTADQTASPNLCDEFPDNQLHTIEDTEECGCYWQCFKGKATHQCCAHCFLYDNNLGWCTDKNDPNFGGCGGRHEDKDCNPDPAPGLCPYPDGYFEDSRTCDRYFICHYDQPKTKKCEQKSEGDIVNQQLLYNYEQVMCDWQSRVDCDIRPICQTVEGDGEDMTYKHCQCQGASISAPADFSCPPAELGIFGDPFNCQKYYFCNDGAIVEEGVCSKDTFWDEAAADCVAGGKCKGRPVCQDIQNSDLCFCNHE